MTMTKQTLAERISSYSCHGIALADDIGTTDKSAWPCLFCLRCGGCLPRRRFLVAVTRYGGVIVTVAQQPHLALGKGERHACRVNRVVHGRGEIAFDLGG